MLILITLLWCWPLSRPFLPRPNRNNGSIISSGEKREYLLYVPRSYDPEADAAGHQPARRGLLAGPANEVASGTGWPRRRFIVVYPSGLEDAGPRVWRVGGGPSHE